MRWLADRVRGVINSWTERAIAAALIAAGYFLWRSRDDDISVDFTMPAWTAGLAVLAVVVALLLLVRWIRRRASREEFEELANLVDLGAFYAIHLYDALESLQKILHGTIPNVTAADFIETGVLQPAREFLMQRPGEDVRLSVLVPDGREWRMWFAAGYRLESKKRFRLSIDASFSRHAYETGQIQFSLDLTADPRFIPHPDASRTYHSLISTPIRCGDDVVAVLNVDSTYQDAFSQPDFIYVGLLGAIVGVVWSVAEVAPRDAPALEEGQVQE
jgi:GAF domain-containing protein